MTNWKEKINTEAVNRLGSVSVLCLLIIATVWTTGQARAGQESDKESVKGLRTVRVAPDVKVSGIAKTAPADKPVVGALVALLRVGSETPTKENLLSWGRTNADGKFEMNNSVKAGKYQLRVKALGYEDIVTEVEIAKKDEKGAQLVIELQPSK